MTNDGSSIVVLGKYCDALYVSVLGRLKPGVAEDLHDAKRSLTGCDGMEETILVTPELPGGPFRLRPHGRGRYGFVLDNAVLRRLEITEATNLPALLLQFDTRALYENDLEGLGAMVEDVAGSFLTPDFEVRVNRFDLAVDFQSEGWALPDRTDVVTRARKWALDGDSLKPNCATFGRRNETVQVQIYNKTEKLGKGGNAWMEEVWRDGGEYEGGDVWRVECRFFRKMLRGYGVDTVPDLRLGLGTLVRAVVGGAGVKPWLRVASANTRDRRSELRPAAPWWEEICQALLDGEPETGLPGDRGMKKPDLDHTEAMLVAYVARWTALGGGEGFSSKTSLDDVLDSLKDCITERLDSKGLTFEEAVNRKTGEVRATASPVTGEPPSLPTPCTTGVSNPASEARRRAS